MNMNAREKFLIIILTALIILLGGFKLLIEPEIKRLVQVNTDFDMILGEKQKIQNNIIRSSVIDNENKNMEEKIKFEVEPFFPSLENDKVQIFFHNIADNIGIKYDSFIMTDKIPSRIINPVIAGDDITYPAKEAADEIDNINNNKSNTPVTGKVSNPQSNQQTKDIIEMMTVTMQFRATYEKTIALLDGIKNSSRIVRVSSVVMSANDQGLINANISVECYGIEKFTEGDEFSEDDLPTPEGKINPFLP